MLLAIIQSLSPENVSNNSIWDSFLSILIASDRMWTLKQSNDSYQFLSLHCKCEILRSKTKWMWVLCNLQPASLMQVATGFLAQNLWEGTQPGNVWDNRGRTLLHIVMTGLTASREFCWEVWGRGRDTQCVTWGMLEAGLGRVIRGNNRVMIRDLHTLRHRDTSLCQYCTVHCIQTQKPGLGLDRRFFKAKSKLKLKVK